MADPKSLAAEIEAVTVETLAEAIRRQVVLLRFNEAATLDQFLDTDEINLLCTRAANAVRDHIASHTLTVDRLALLMGQVWLSVKAPQGGTVYSADEFEAVAPEDYAACCTIASAVLTAVDLDRANNPAESFARRVHAGQVDKGGAPYTGHLCRVAARACAHAEAMGLPRQHAEWCQQVGWLHDTIEDTGTTADDLLDAGFDPVVVQAIQLLTRPEGKPYLECVAAIIASGDRLAMIVKLSDNEDNLDPARALPTASPAHTERYQRSAEMLRAALAPPPSTTTRGRDA